MYKKCFWTLVGLALAASPGFCGFFGPRSLPDLEQSADLIVVGAAGNTVAVGITVNFSLQITRVVKGDPSLAGSSVSVEWSNPAAAVAAAQNVTAPGSGLWFLQRPSSAWLLVPVLQGDVPLKMTFFPASAGPILSAYAYGPTASLSDKLVSELCSAIEGASGTYSFQLYSLQNGPLDQLKSPVVATLYQRLASSMQVQQRILGLSGLIRGGSGAALAAAAQGAAGFTSYPKESGILWLSVLDSFRATDPDSITALGKAALDSGNSSVIFREAAAHALAAIHTAATLPYLAALLDDPDESLRVEAIGGMGSFANGLPIETAAGVPSLAYLHLPASAPYQTAETLAHFALGSQAIEANEASYLSFWQTWWAQERGNLGY